MQSKGTRIAEPLRLCLIRGESHTKTLGKYPWMLLQRISRRRRIRSFLSWRLVSQSTSNTDRQCVSKRLDKKNWMLGWGQPNWRNLMSSILRFLKIPPPVALLPCQSAVGPQPECLQNWSPEAKPNSSTMCTNSIRTTPTGSSPWNLPKTVPNSTPSSKQSRGPVRLLALDFGCKFRCATY